MHPIAIGAVLFGALACPLGVSAQDKGTLAFNNHCRTCHSLKPGDNRLGPTLAGVMGRKSGTAPGYGSYSNAMSTAGVTWNEQTLEQFITDPEAVVPNNNMKPYKGIPDESIRKDIVAYLKSKAKGS